MLGHISIGSPDLVAAGAFYGAEMAPIGWMRVWTEAGAIGYWPECGEDRFAVFHHEVARPAGPGFHLCLNAPSEAAVDAACSAALAHGGRDNGPPGPRPQYGPDYCACFFLDPDGWKLEVLHKAEWDQAYGV